MFLLTAAASSGQFRNTGPITTMHLLLIGVLIVLVVLGLIWGIRQKRERVAAQREEAQRTEALLSHPGTPDAAEPATPVAGAELGAEPVGAAAAAPAPASKARAVTKPAPAEKAAAKPVAKRAPAKEAAPPAKVAKAPAARPAAKPVTAPAPAKTAAKSAAAAAAPAEASAAKAPAAKPAAAKPAPAKPAAAKPAAASAYALIDVKGLGPKAVPLLEGMGVATLADLAGLSAARAAEVDAGLGNLSGRLTRDRWIDQAKLLSAGKIAEFEATYGKL